MQPDDYAEADIKNSADTNFKRALDDSANEEAQKRLTMNRIGAFAVGAVVGVLVINVILRVMK